MRTIVVLVLTRNQSWNVRNVARLVTLRGIAKVVIKRTQMLVVWERGLRTIPKTKVDAIAWWIDFGATTHVCKDRCWFKTYKPVEDGSVLYLGDDHFAPVHGKGSVVQEFSSEKSITLFNVLYVLKLCKNLISGPVLNKYGYKQVYESNKYILSKCGVFVGFGYYINGYVHYKRMLEMSKDDLISAIDENLEKCTTYMVVVRLPDPKRKTLGEKVIDCIFVGYAELPRHIAIQNLVIHQIDVKTTFLNGDLDEEVYMKQAKGLLCRIISISKFDSSDKGVIICLYVDDMLIFGIDQNQVDKTKKFLSSRFSIKDMGEADIILGINIRHENKRIVITQSHYTILKKFNRKDRSPVSTPMDPVEKLKPNKGKPVDQLQYLRAIGCLMYATISTRSDIGYDVGRLMLEAYSNALDKSCWRFIFYDWMCVPAWGRCHFMGFQEANMHHWHKLNIFVQKTESDPGNGPVASEDRISSLPDELIHKILSFVDTKYAVQTSMLSSRWKLIWKAMPCLDFASYKFCPLPNFSKFVTNVLSHRNHQIDVSSVKLDFDGAASQAFVRKIANYAFSDNVQELTVTIPLNHQCLTPKTPWDFPALTTLHLSEITLCDDNCKSADLFSKCVNLRNVTLETFLLDCKPPKWFKDSCHSVNKVTVSLSYHSGLRPYNEEDFRETINMLQELCSAKFLTLSIDIIECVSAFPDLLSLHPSPFRNLITLNIDSGWGKVSYKVKMSTEATNFLLENSPNATFVMDLPEKEYIEIDELFNEIGSVEGSKFAAIKPIDEYWAIDIAKNKRLIDEEPSRSFVHVKRNKLHIGKTSSDIRQSMTMTSTRPDIAYVVGRLSRFTSNHSRKHWKAITRVFKYLRGTKDYGLSYVGYPSVLEGYSDASWINHVEDSFSTSGWVFLLGDVTFHGLSRSKHASLVQTWNLSL
nr:hypothetical protein [Tanacetum cinerariifolium]